jgi:DNA polymerase III subunit epsilon
MTRAGLSLASADTMLTDRAAELLAAGPADAQTLISHVCMLPGAPRAVAEHMAAALFAGHQRFVREQDGRWRLREARPLAADAPASVAEPSLAGASFVVVDVETTGTRALAGDRITEIAAVLVRDGSATLVFDSLINPERPIPPYITQLTNISWQMVKDAPRFGDVCERLVEVLEGHVFVAHNVNFDWRFVDTEIKRATGRSLDGRRLCTVRMARRLLPQLRRRSLDSVTQYYGIDVSARHRAGGDALATAQVFLRMMGDARAQGYESLDDLERFLSGPSARTRRRRRPSSLPQPVREDTTA